MLVSLVVPTLNESGSIPVLAKQLTDAYPAIKGQGKDLEVVFVDDGSGDGTQNLIREWSKNSPFPVRLVQRNVRGLASAVVEGFRNSKGEVLGVMDSDLSHPPEVIPALLQRISGADLVIGSRYLPGGGVEDWPFIRRLYSRWATFIAKPICGRVTDPMSGFFFLKRPVIEGITLSPLGYKILLEIVVKGKHAKVAEVPYLFRNRNVGKSKMTFKIMAAYGIHLAKLYLWKIFH